MEERRTTMRRERAVDASLVDRGGPGPALTADPAEREITAPDAPGDPTAAPAIDAAVGSRRQAAAEVAVEAEAAPEAEVAAAGAPEWDGEPTTDAATDELPGDTAADERLIAILESVLFAAGEPLTLARLAEVVPGPSRSELRAAIAELTARAEREQRGIRIVEVVGGFQCRTAPVHAEWVRRLFQQKPWRLTRATLETLAIIAYKQPITRAEIEAIRAVDVDSVLASLLTRKLVKILGRKEVIGRPLLYGTTRQFLEVFGLKDLASLPALTEVAASMPDGVAAGAAAGSDETWSGDDGESESGENAGTNDGGENDGSGGDPTAEAAGGGGDLLAPRGGNDDPAGSGEAERQAAQGAGDAREADGQDPGRR